MEGQDLFNLDANLFDLGSAPATAQTLFAPKYTDGKDNVYECLIRFLPNPKDLKHPIIKKYTYWLEDEAFNIRGYFDSLSSIGQECPIVDKYWKLKKSGNAMLESIADEKLNRKEQYASLVQIIKDPQNPDLEGKIMVYKFPKTVFKFIDEKLNPPTSRVTGQADPVINVFDLFQGRDFNLLIDKKGDWPNYDQSKFLDNPSTVRVADDLGNLREATANDKPAIQAMFADAPDLGDYDFKAWTDEQDHKVRTYLQSLGSTGAAMHTITSAPATPARETAQAEAQGSGIGNDELNDILNATSTQAAPAQTATPQPATTTAPSETDDLEDLLNKI